MEYLGCLLYALRLTTAFMTASLLFGTHEITRSYEKRLMKAGRFGWTDTHTLACIVRLRLLFALDTPYVSLEILNIAAIVRS